MVRNRAITISREYGSGGREIGEKLAQRLGIPFYDKELIAMIARKGILRLPYWRPTMKWTRI